MVPAPDPERSTIGKKIALLRRERGLTQRALARAVGVTERSVQSWEQGHTHPYRHLKEIEAALGRPLSPRTEITLIDEMLSPELEDRVELAERRGGDRIADLETRLRNVEERLAKLEKRSARPRAKKT